MSTETTFIQIATTIAIIIACIIALYSIFFLHHLCIKKRRILTIHPILPT